MNNITENPEWESLLKLADPSKRQENWSELGRQLYKIERASKKKGTFQGICEALGLAGRTGYYMAKIMRKLDQLDVEPPEGLGWTTLKDVVELLNADNYEDVFEKCQTLSKKELAEYMFSQIQDQVEP